MIYIRSIREVNYDDYDEIYAIVRSWKNKSNPHIKHLPCLSPSDKLYKMFLKAKEDGTWGEVYFNTIYVPIFIEDTYRNAEAKKWLNRFAALDKKGKKICLLCFCTDEHICHRSIVAGLLQGVGCNVDAKEDYSKYYNHYIRTDCPFRHENGNCSPHGGFCTSVDIKECLQIRKNKENK